MNLKTYSLLLLLVGVNRLIEMGWSRANQHRLAAKSVERIHEPHFRWMILLHVGVLIGSVFEAWYFKRPFRIVLAVPMGFLFLLANGLRWWVIATMAEHWNVQVMNSTKLGVVSTGPFRWVRHPNYLAVFVELAALPLIYGAWITALLATAAHVWILRKRLQVEESILFASPIYKAEMASKPRFLPGLF